MARTPAEVLRNYRRDQILEAARQVINENGFANTSVDQIAQRAELSRSTVYQYFASKEELLKGCLAVGREIFVAHLVERIDPATSVERQLTAFFEVCLERVDENREFFRAVAGLESLDGNAERGDNALVELIQDFNRVLGQVLDDAAQRGELPAKASPEMRRCFGILIMGAMAARSRQDAPAPPTLEAESLSLFAVSGLRGPR